MDGDGYDIIEDIKKTHPVEFKYKGSAKLTNRLSKWLRQNLGDGETTIRLSGKQNIRWTIYGNDRYCRFKGRTFFVNEADALLFRLSLY